MSDIAHMRYLPLVLLLACGRTDLLTQPTPPPPCPAPVVVPPCEVIDVSITYRTTDNVWCGISGIAMTNRQFAALALAHPSCRVFQFRETWVMDCEGPRVIPIGATADKCGWTVPQAKCD